VERRLRADLLAQEREAAASDQRLQPRESKRDHK
jgi:hypothetical protein